MPCNIRSIPMLLSYTEIKTKSSNPATCCMPNGKQKGLLGIRPLDLSRPLVEHRQRYVVASADAKRPSTL